MFRRSITKHALNNNVLNMPHSGIRSVMEAAWKLERDGRQVRHLEVGQPDFGTPKPIVEACSRALLQEANQRYCPNLGVRELREAAADYLTKRGQQTIPYNRVAVTPGCVFSMAASMLSVAGPGQKVLLPNPGWPNYEMAAQAVGVSTVYYSLTPEDGWQPDFEEIAKLLEDHSDIKLIVLCNPSNPTGQVFNGEVLDKFLQLSEQAGIHVLSDEIYGDIAFGESSSAPSILNSKYFSVDNHIVISGVSKTYSMTGFRVGFLTASDLLIDQISKLGESFISCGVPFAQVAAAAALRGCADKEVAHMLQCYSDRRSIVVDTLSRYEMLDYLTGGPPAGALYCLLFVGHVLPLFQNDVTLFTISMLEATGIATSPGSCFGSASNNHIRICFAGVDNETLRSAMDDLCRYISGLAHSFS
eukprot:TRINITY_DN1448_c0_g1_i1.p1 TRINITY_DN1448_c0_g1~~TRINITY_DN1448_c0_g1_i1.p1  ORF type:complete len:432 (+),score=64.72 TRINITY_DN1448_c0_g1_i1:50-1297(+)